MKKLFITIFGLDKLYDRKIGFSYLADILYVAIAVILLNIFVTTSIFNESDGFLVRLVLITIIALIALYYLQEIMQAFAMHFRIKARKYITGVSVTDMAFTNISVSSAKEELGSKLKINVISTKNNVAVYDIRHDYYRSTKYGDYKSKESYYTVIEYKLKRKLPNVIFDAKRAKGRQFSKIFIGAQKITLEGNFSEYFDVYFPMFYQIDGLSFITPEVMDAMITLRDYDFEIKDASLLCYAPLLSTQEISLAIDAMATLHNKLNDNLESYRDERLSFNDGKKQVTEFGSKLLISPKKYIPAFLLSGIGMCGLVYFGITEDSEIFINEGAIVLYALFFGNAYKIISIIINNKKIIASFKNSYIATQ